MMKKTTTVKRGLALFLALLMCLGMLNITAFAAEEPDSEISGAVESSVDTSGSDVSDVTGDNGGITDVDTNDEADNGGETSNDADASDSVNTEDVDANDGETGNDVEDADVNDGETGNDAEDADVNGGETGNDAEDADANDGETGNDVEDVDVNGGETGNDVEDADVNGGEAGNDAEDADSNDNETGNDVDVEIKDAGEDGTPTESEDLVELSAPSVVAPIVETIKELSIPVKLFVAAADALPESVTEDNFDEVGSILQNILTLYNALSEEEQDSDEVLHAFMKVMALYEQYDESAKAMTLVLIPTTPVAKIGDQEYTILSMAVLAAQPGDTIVFQADIAQSITVSKDVTFDLNGYSWTGRGDTTLTAVTSAATSNFTVTVMNGSMTSVSGYRSIETQLPTTVRATTCKADVVVENMTFTTSGSISSELSVSTGSVGRVGGVIYVENGDLSVTNCTFTGAAGVSGSHIAITPRTATVYPEVNLTIANSTFEGADSTGAVWASALGNMTGRTVNVNISGSTFTNNKYGLYCKVDNSGSAANITANLEDCTFTGSTGSAIYTYGQTKKHVTLNLKDTKITDSTAQYGGLYAYQYTDITMTGGEVSNITGTSSYGAIESLKSGSFKMDGTVVSGNTGYRVVHIEAASEVSIQNAVFSNNTMTTSDSISMGGGGTVTLKNSTGLVTVSNTKFTENYAKNYGGGLCVYTTSTASPLTIDGCTFTGNTSDGIGGGIYLYNKSTTTIHDTTITGNTANSSAVGAGAGLYVGASANGATVNLTGDTRIYKNETPNATVKTGLIGVASEICIANSSTITMPLNIEDGIGVVEENGNTHTLTKFNGTLSSSTTYRYYVGYYTNTVEPLRVYLGTAEQHTSDTAVVKTTLADAVDAAKENGLDTVYICGNVKITAEDEEVLNNSGVTFARCANHPNSNMFTISGNVTLDGAQINGMNVSSNSAMISVPANAHLTITGETVIENGKNSGNGGAVCVSQGQLTMTGGTITNNTANQGGGIYAMSGKLVSFEGGTVSKNVATGGNGGGGAYIEATSSEFGVNGGRTLFDGNSANELGGGVFLVNGTNANTHHYIYKATFTNNSSYRFMQYFDGGAIYIQSGTTAHMKNVYVSGNKDGDGALDKNGFTAVAVCPTGELAVYELDGLLSVNNGYNPDIGVIAGGAMPSTAPKVYLASHAPGGGEVSYTLSNGTVVDTSKYQFLEGYFRLYTSASDSAIDAAYATAEADGVIITGNYATQYGSGIMTNGILKIGTETVSLKVVKDWADGAENHDDDQILVYLTKDGEIVDQNFRSDSFVILNKDNNWSYTWTNLGDQFTWGVKEASVGGYTSEVKVEKDTQFGVIADKYYIATITNTPGAETDKLSVTKTAYGLNPDASYKFTLELDNVDDSVFALQLDGTLYPIYNNKITFYLKDGQSAVVDGLPKGFTYKVTEEEGDYNTYVFESVTTNIDGSIYSVNVVNVAKTEVSVQKIWVDDAGYVRPKSITFKLLSNGKEVDSQTLTPRDMGEDGSWSCTFTDLPKYDAEGNAILYTVEEEGVPNYTVAYEQNPETGVWEFTNTRVLSVEVNKVWHDAFGNVTNDHPEAVTVNLYRVTDEGEGAQRELVRTLYLNEANEWQGIFENLPVGNYVVEEATVSGYAVEYGAPVIDNGNSSITITNIYNEGCLTINKAVEGGPESASTEKVYTFTVTGPDGFERTVAITGAGSETLTGLVPGAYVVTEDEEDAAISGYNWSVAGNGVEAVVTAKEGAVVTITNTYTPDDPETPGNPGGGPNTTSLTVNKIWVGDDGIERPASVTVQLYRNGSAYGAVVTLNEDNGWSYTWKDLNASDTWTVGEVNVPEGYTSTVRQNGNTVTITNTYSETDIPDEDVPQASLPEDPEDLETPDVEIPDEDVPLADVPEVEIPDESVPLDGTPQTGDDSRTGLWAAICAMSMAGIAALLGKKREDEEA